ncbi:c-type cytochrome [Marinobacter sp. DUT-3]|uniref:c-type cytochrome n=1 Tax=unclassified Marinobacter TaxID=83889 RepID=UPI00387AE7F2
MKRVIKIAATLAVAGGVALGAVVGPELWAGYHFLKVVDQQTTEYESNGGEWPQLQDTCALCHGQNGQSGNAMYPSLAGLSASYIENQLNAYANGRRHSPQMQPLARSLTDNQIEMLAAYFERQAPVTVESPGANAFLGERGQNIVDNSGCTTCHGDQLNGSSSGPRLAGQGEIYLVDQLTAFKRGTRKDPTQVMNGMAAALSEEDILATAHYLSNLSPTSRNTQ